MRFDWDENKNQLNIEKHKADFNDAIQLFNNNLLVIPDERFNYRELRFIGYGYVNGRLMNVIYTERLPNIIRIISFRKANSREKRLYEKIIKN
ncbi:MAG: uncharacterized protein QG673_470 [Pseudomonadota bacterium]|nr:uncharacterized protein [Pseudomonadota bacterium]